MHYRSEKVVELKDKYEHYEKLLSIDEEKIKPILKQFETTVGKCRNVERLISFFISLLTGLIIFIIGYFIGNS